MCQEAIVVNILNKIHGNPCRVLRRIAGKTELRQQTWEPDEASSHTALPVYSMVILNKDIYRYPHHTQFSFYFWKVPRTWVIWVPAKNIFYHPCTRIHLIEKQNQMHSLDKKIIHRRSYSHNWIITVILSPLHIPNFRSLCDSWQGFFRFDQILCRS